MEYLSNVLIEEKNRQHKISYEVRSYVPLLTSLINVLYPDLQYHIDFFVTDEYYTFGGYYKPKIKILTRNVSTRPYYNPYNFYAEYKILNSDTTINEIELSDAIYSYLPDTLYYIILEIQPPHEEIVCMDYLLELKRWDFENIALRKEVEARYNDYSDFGYSVNN